MEEDRIMDISGASKTQIVRGLIDANGIRTLVDAHGHRILLVNEAVATVLAQLGVSVDLLDSRMQTSYEKAYDLGNYHFRLTLPQVGNWAGHEVVPDEVMDAIPELPARPKKECMQPHYAGRGPSLAEVVASKLKQKIGRKPADASGLPPR